MTTDDIGAIRGVPSLEGKVSPEEWRIRVDPAACYRPAPRRSRSCLHIDCTPVNGLIALSGMGARTERSDVIPMDSGNER